MKSLKRVLDTVYVVSGVIGFVSAFVVVVANI